MNRNVIEDSERQISYCIFRSLFISLFAIVIKVLQLSIYHNAETGLLDHSAMSTALGVITVLCMVYVAIEYVFLTIRVKRLAGYVKLTTQPLIGLTLVLVAICFFFQGIMGILTELTSKTGTALTGVINLLTIISAVDYGIQGVEIVLGKKKSHFWLHMIPVIWSVAVLMNVVVTCPLTVSMQSTISKVVCCGLLVMFMYYTARWACGYENRSSSWTGFFFRVSFCSLGTIWVFPYCLVYLFGVKDDTQNMPYLAILGLTLYGFVVLLQYMVLMIHKVERQKK